MGDGSARLIALENVRMAEGSRFGRNNGDNNVGRFMRNVLDAFLRPGPLPGSEFVGEEKLWR
jgi:hypothetical protein